MPPYVSSRRLVANSLSAMLAAIEVYNKPRMEYRDEVTTLLVVNAWELALKAALKKAKKPVFYRKRRNEPYRSLSAEDALKRVVENKLFPKSIDDKALSTNIGALIEYRNRTTHLYAADLAQIIYPFLQTSVLNYRDFMLDNFQKDLADSITWQLLPLGAKAPSQPVQFLKTDSSSSAANEVQDFLNSLSKKLDQAEAGGADMHRVAAVFDIHLQATKAVTGADLVVRVAKEGGEVVVIKKTDPNLTHPFTATELLDLVNAKREGKGRKLTSYDHQALCWKQALRDDSRMAWKHSKLNTHSWSGDAVSHMAKLDDTFYDEVRAEYGVHLRQKKKAAK
jgi:hypothetical protein